MEQGIRIVFFDNPQEGDRIWFYGSISSGRLLYNNGLDIVDFEYTNDDSEILSNPFNRVKIGPNIQETADNTKLFLDNNGYQISNIPISNIIKQETYFFIDSYYEYPEKITFEIDFSNERVVINSFFIPTVVPVIGQKYYMQYKNIVGDEYKLRIFKKEYKGDSTDIYGRIIIEKNEVKSHLDVFRGTGLTIEIEANVDVDIEDLYFINETEYIVRLEKNNFIIYNGFLKPDGVFQSYVNDEWIVSLSSVDGLGFLENLSFVDENGFRFLGKMNCLEIIQKCLKRTGSDMRIKTYVNVFYEGLSVVDNVTDILKNVYLDTNRFIKGDDNTIMSCKDVLNSVLTIFKAVITQENGEWYIYRPGEFYNNNYPKFKYYDLNLNPTGTITANIYKEIGSQIDNFYPHHCSGNQIIEVIGAISAFRLGYKYGFIGSLLDNGNLSHEAGTKIYEGWTVQEWDENPGTGYLKIDPTSNLGISFISSVSDGVHPIDEVTALISEESEILLDGYSIELKARIISYGFPVRTRFSVVLYPEDGSEFYDLIQSGQWTQNNSGIGWLVNSDGMPNFTGELVDSVFEKSFSIKSEPLPKSGRVQVFMSVPGKGRTSYGSESGVFNPPAVLVDVKSIELINTFSGNNVIGEFHTVSRTVAVSSIVKENETVYNGDNDNKVYLGAIYKNDQESFTSNWYRKDKVESKPILRITAEDELRIAQKPNKMFTGDTYGQISYISMIKINNITGLFMPIFYNYDTYNNINKLKLLEFYNNEMTDIKYEKTQDYGETVKPTIVG